MLVVKRQEEKVGREWWNCMAKLSVKREHRKADKLR
jgi:hypothetical protein